MINLRTYSACHKEFRESTVENLTEQERKSVCAYIVNERYPKDENNFSDKVEHIKEYELPVYNKHFQEIKYLEYSLLPHVFLNPLLTEGLTHIGMLHSDISFQNNSIKDIILDLEQDPNQIFYNTFFGPLQNPDGGPLYLSPEQVYKICDYTSIKMKKYINPLSVLHTGWIGSQCIAPIKVFWEFGKFMQENYKEMEEILLLDKWDLQSYPDKHSPCGFIERIWGFYLVSLNMPIKRMRIDHIRENFSHEHGKIVK